MNKVKTRGFLGDSADFPLQESETRRAARKVATVQELKLRKVGRLLIFLGDSCGTPCFLQKRHLCGISCTCDGMSRGALRDAVSDTPEAHMRENLRCKFGVSARFPFSGPKSFFSQTWISARS